MPLYINNFFFKPVILLYFLFVVPACNKEWLEEKPLQSLVVPQTLKDFQGILNNELIFNNEYPILGEAGSDHSYFTEELFTSLSETERNIYTWSSSADFYADRYIVGDWERSYKRIFNTNLILEGLEKILPDNPEWTDVKGRALFFRGTTYYCLAQVFCKPYNQQTAGSDLGIVLKLTSDVNKVSVRSSVQESYEQAIGDLKTAADLLPITQQYKTQPSKLAAYGMLARAYLSMEKYDEALIYANKCLEAYDVLTDFNTITPFDPSTYVFPFDKYDPEVIFFSFLSYETVVPELFGGGFVSPALYDLYEENDLRKTVFFTNMKGGLSYTGTYGDMGVYPFGGIATPEMYLTRAECLARKGETELALKDLNTLLQKRWSNTVTYTPVTATDSEDALRKILVEREKELCFRGLRWSDLRRLNKDDRFKKELKRTIDGTTYILPPNDNRYVYPIPKDEIIYSKLEQNPR